MSCALDGPRRRAPPAAANTFHGSLVLGLEGPDWIRGGITTLDQKGSTRRTYQPAFYDGSGTDFRAVVALPTVPYAVSRYDAFGRARGVIAEDGSVVWTSYHSLSTDVCDPLDNDPGSEHYRTCTTARSDGHGRTVDQVLRNRDPDYGTDEVYHLWSYYRADNAVTTLVRAHSAAPRPVAPTSAALSSTRHVVRTFAYDSVGRRLSSDDPDTDDPDNLDQISNSWRYLFNRVGDLAAVRDPRGCGQNFFYDLGGRLRGEQYVSCGEAQPAETPHGDNEVGGLISDTLVSAALPLDVVYHYDDYPGWTTAPGGASGVLGRATGVSDRGQRAAIAYDDRGNVIWTTRQLAVIPAALTLSGFDPAAPRPVETETPASASILYDDLHSYTRTAAFDHAGRPTSIVLPRDPDFVGTAPDVVGLISYNSRGLPANATLEFREPDSPTVRSVHPIVAGIQYLRDGLVSSLTYGDTGAGASRPPTESRTTYDIRRRPVRMFTTRAATPGAELETLGAVTTVTDQQLIWDAASNLTGVIDHRDAEEWPVGHRPQSVHIRHDALYRVVNADYDYTQPGGARTTADSGSDWRQSYARAAAVDPMRSEPPAMVVPEADTRVISLAWSWDYLANTNEWTDDRESFYERSIGTITNGDDTTESDSTRPSALYLATNLESAGSGSGPAPEHGWLEVDYGVGGNMTSMTVHAQCVDGPSACVDPGGDLGSRRAALRTGCACAVEQHYAYRWDELNRLAEARRYDRTPMTAGAWRSEVRQRYRYDGANARMVKQTLDAQACGAGTGLIPCERIAIYPYPGDFERRGLSRGFGEYTADPDVLRTETQYVVAGARIVSRVPASTGEAFDADERIVVPLTDLIQTTAAAFDVRTGRLIEASTYYPNGGHETFLDDADARAPPEPNGFTGKEADEDVGLVYFGERYLVARLGRWASPDPLHIHASGGGEALNSYHYVSGNLLAGRDPLGLDADKEFVAEAGQSQRASSQDNNCASVGDCPGRVIQLDPVSITGRLPQAPPERTSVNPPPGGGGSRDPPPPQDTLADQLVATAAVAAGAVYGASVLGAAAAAAISELALDGSAVALNSAVDNSATDFVLENWGVDTEPRPLLQEFASGGQTPYGASDLSRLARTLRGQFANPLSGRNIALFETRDGAITSSVSEGAAFGVSRHSEQFGVAALEAAVVDPGTVVRIYSEFEPCTLRTVCRTLAERFPNAQITYSFEYGGVDTVDDGVYSLPHPARALSRAAGRAAFRSTMRATFPR